MFLKKNMVETRKTWGLILLPLFTTVFVFCASNAWSQDSDGLKLPEDIAARQGAGEDRTSTRDQDFYIEERRIGGRLERVTVRRQFGLDEVYENREVDSMWLSEENELGDVPNVRRWTIGSW